MPKTATTASAKTDRANNDNATNKYQTITTNRTLKLQKLAHPSINTRRRTTQNATRPNLQQTPDTNNPTNTP